MPTCVEFSSTLNRNHPAWLSLASSRERHPDARSVLITPRGFDQQPADQRSRSRDPTAPMLLAGGVLTRHETELGNTRGAWSRRKSAAPRNSESPSTYRSHESAATAPRVRDTARAVRDVGQP